MLYSIVATVIPALDTDRHEAAWAAYWERGVTRRLLPGVLAALLVAGGLPVRGQWTDFAAYSQRALQFVRTQGQFLETKLQWAKENLQVESELLRQASLAYCAARQAQAAWGRTATSNISLSYVSSLPTIDVFQHRHGETQHLRLRPVFRVQDRNPKFNPQVQNPFQGMGNWRMLDFDVDRSVVRAKNPDKNKSLQQIQQEALQDGLESWRLSQEIAGVDVLAQDLPDSPSAYRPLTEAEAKHRKDRAVKLQALMLRSLQRYGEDSPQYTEAKARYQTWVRESSTEAGEARAQAAVAALQRIDAEAAGLAESFAVQSASMRNMALQAEAAAENIKEVAKEHDSKPGQIATYMSYLGWDKVLDTVSQIGKGPQAQVASLKEEHGNQLKSTILQQQAALQAEETAKVEARARLEETQRQMKDLAARKAAVLQRLRLAQGAEKFADEVALTKVTVDDAMEALAIRSFAANLPGGMVPVVRDDVARRLQGQGVVSASEGLVVVRDQIAKGVQEATDQAQKDLSTTLKDLPKRLSGGVLDPLLGGLADGTKAVFGQAFDLRRVGTSNKPMLHRRLG